jgi:hypothetical protein
MRTHIVQVKALLRGDIADIDDGRAQILASDGWLPDRPINVPVYMAGQGPKSDDVIPSISGTPAARLPRGGAGVFAEIRVYADVPTATADVT